MDFETTWTFCYRIPVSYLQFTLNLMPSVLTTKKSSKEKKLTVLKTPPLPHKK